ncbi:hypothetical protein BELL_0008g00210 [Botrytis elliptica]|uniref:Uncharacterized protein n=1 Tax=Botrytis elliptica TaxID=278938 RepID=A0A4Z1K3C2_9HELO|nr:hypothetical protein BELL_0008g00210 [Botrytis elliptica]
MSIFAQCLGSHYPAVCKELFEFTQADDGNQARKIAPSCSTGRHSELLTLLAISILISLWRDTVTAVALGRDWLTRTVKCCLKIKQSLARLISVHLTTLLEICYLDYIRYYVPALFFKLRSTCVSQEEING